MAAWNAPIDRGGEYTAKRKKRATGLNQGLARGRWNEMWLWWVGAFVTWFIGLV
jgi:hypothetical protein